MKKIYFVIVALLVLGMALAACSAPEAPVEEAAPAEEEAAPTEEEAAPAEEEAEEEAASEELLFVAINKSADQQYFIDLQNSFVESAEGAGAEALKFDAKLDPSLGVSLVNDAISAGASGIAITVPDHHR